MLNELAIEIRIINKEKGWNVFQESEWDTDTYKVPASLALIHSEVSEALEAYRKNDKANFKEELADIIIRTLDLAGGMGFDIDAGVMSKLDKNRERPHRHGGKLL